MNAPVAGVFPGSFDPLTIAHLAIAEAAVEAAGLDRIDLALSARALGKDTGAQSSLDARAAAIRRAARNRPWLGLVVTDAQLIADIARGYAVVVMGADKWAQVRDPQWYGGDGAARDAAVSSLPRVLVAPRPGYDVVGAEVLDLAPHLADVSSTRARSGEHHLVHPDTRRMLVVDGNNVMGSRPDGWWNDRAAAQRRLVAELQALAARTGDHVLVVFDGRPLDDLPEGEHAGVEVTYATRAGRDAGDDRLVDEIARHHDPGALTVVTSDRRLAARARELGATVEGAGSFSRELGAKRR